MNIVPVYSSEVRMKYINGTMYEFTRHIDNDSDGYRSITARRWTGHKWIVVHRWESGE